MSRSGSLVGGVVLVGAGLLFGCSGEAPLSGMVLTSFRQAEAEGVFLNETLVLHFDREVDPASVTRRSVRVTGPGGGAARGSLVVERDQVRFAPDPPRSSDLTDGGLLPGSAYEVEVVGFPYPDGLRARSGAPLVAGYVGRFATVAADAPLVFEDTTGSNRDRLLSLASDRIEPTAGIRLTSAVPLDPTTVRAEDYVLVRATGGADEPDELTSVHLAASLLQNRADGAEILLLPRHADGTPRALMVGEYQLVFDVQGFALRDLGGRPVRPVWWAHTPWATLRVEAEPRAPRHREEFLDAGDASPEAPADFDGTAHWDDTGGVRVRFPRAAGTGADGPRALDGALEGRDVHATRLEVAEGAAARLPDEGLVVLRAQGELRVAGRLERTVETGEAARREGEGVELWLDRVRRGAASFDAPPLEPALVPGTSVTRVLAEAAERDPAWTVLVAGGDLVVSGEVVVDGPLLLVAGGRIRVPGRVEAREVWKLREGGGTILPFVRDAPLVFAPPDHNPLAAPLRLAVLSAPVVPPRGVLRWRGAEWSGRAGVGRFHVRFFGERRGPDGVEVVGPADDPVLLGACEAVRFRVELELEPGALWDPPFVDHVELLWEEPAPR